MTSDALIQRLRVLTGQRFRYLGEEWCLIEVLGQEDALVLGARSGNTGQVQSTQYGQPNRRVQQTLTLPLSGGDQDGYSDEVLELLAGRLSD
jgi:hypothetical protein